MKIESEKNFYKLTYKIFYENLLSLTDEIFDNLYLKKQGEIIDINIEQKINEYEKNIIKDIIKIFKEHKIKKKKFVIFYLMVWLLLLLYGYLIISKKFKKENINQVLNQFQNLYKNGYNSFNLKFEQILNFGYSKFYDQETLIQIYDELKDILNDKCDIKCILSKLLNKNNNKEIYIYKLSFFLHSLYLHKYINENIKLNNFNKYIKKFLYKIIRNKIGIIILRLFLKIEKTKEKNRFIKLYDNLKK